MRKYCIRFLVQQFLFYVLTYIYCILKKIVTTWEGGGEKQFRPDYWYLGGHIIKLCQNQRKKHIFESLNNMLAMSWKMALLV